MDIICALGDMSPEDKHVLEHTMAFMTKLNMAKNNIQVAEEAVVAANKQVETLKIIYTELVLQFNAECIKIAAEAGALKEANKRPNQEQCVRCKTWVRKGMLHGWGNNECSDCRDNSRAHH
jgi:hypothetical protein